MPAVVAQRLPLQRLPRPPRLPLALPCRSNLLLPIVVGPSAAVPLVPVGIVATTALLRLHCTTTTTFHSSIRRLTMSLSSSTPAPPPPPHKDALRPIICPSLLSCDLARLADDAQQMLDLGADWLHMDIMDGHFVPNLSFGPPVIASLRQALPPNAVLDCHLMVSDPARWVEPLRIAGASSLTFHLESELPSSGGAAALIQTIRDAGMRVGMVIKPGTPVEALYPYAESLDLILIMTVEPGFSGQAFMPDMMPKVRAVRDRYPTLTLQVDGGLSPSTVDAATAAGANAIVAASAVFGAPDRKAVLDALRDSVSKHLLLG